jgi:hypothetical protein
MTMETKKYNDYGKGELKYDEREEEKYCEERGELYV